MGDSVHKKLTVWQKAMDLVEEVYKLTRLLPKEEIYGLTNQLRRAVISIPSNIAEGYERNSLKEYIHFLSIARGSNSELRTQLQICIEVGYLAEENVTEVIELSDEVGKMLRAMTMKLTAKL